MIKRFIKSIMDSRHIVVRLEGVQTPEEFQRRVDELREQGYL